MSDIKSIIRLNCDEELDIKYFTKDEYITDRTIDYSELLEYINEIEDKNERLENIIKEVSKELKEFNEEYLVSEGDTGVYRYLNKLIEKLNEGE